MAGGPSISWEVPVALLGHVLLATIVMVARCSSSEEPLFKPEDSIQVALAGPPKNVTRMPQKAERAPDAPKAAAADPTVPPPTPTNSDMSFKTPEAPKTKGDPNADARQKAMDELRRRAAVQDLTADVGKEDRLASNPDGVEGDEGSAPSDGTNDPAMARWIAKVKQAMLENWTPLPSQLANPSLRVTIVVVVAPEGKLVGLAEIRKSSGSVSYDQSARRAAEAAAPYPRLPDGNPDGRSFEFTFVPGDAL